METSFYPSITPVSVANIPSKEKLLETMVPLIEESESWPLGTKYEDRRHPAARHMLALGAKSLDYSRMMWGLPVRAFCAAWAGARFETDVTNREVYQFIDTIGGG